MRRGLLLQTVPLSPPIAAPIASSHERRLPLWHGTFWRITPGALALQLCVLWSVTGGWL